MYCITRGSGLVYNTEAMPCMLLVKRWELIYLFVTTFPCTRFRWFKGNENIHHCLCTKYATCVLTIGLCSLLVLCICIYIYLVQCIELLGANCFTSEQYTKLLGLLKDMLEMCFSRASERQAKRQDEDYDEQVEEELEEEVSYS